MKLNQRRSTYIKYAQIWNTVGVPTELKAYSVYWDWYYDNIVYSRRQALKGVKDLCEDFNPNRPSDFKNRMESYFKYDSVATKFERIGEDEWNSKNWFDVLKTDFIKEQGIGNLITQLGRFLESNKNNVGYNYISGVLHVIDGTYFDTDGEIRLKSALRDLSVQSEQGTIDWRELLYRTHDSIGELLNKENEELLSSAFIECISADHVAEHVYNTFQDNYSLQISLRSAFSKIYYQGMEKKIW